MRRAQLTILAIVCLAVAAKPPGRLNTAAGPVPGKLNVHIVPHTHDDVSVVGAQSAGLAASR